MRRKRSRESSIFSMSFLDAITCGFGAVILVFMIIAANIDLRRDSALDELMTEQQRMEIKLVAARNNLIRIRERLAEQLEQSAVQRGVRDALLSEVQTTREQFATLTANDEDREDAIDRLRRELEQLAAETERLSARSVTPEDAGNRIRSVLGEGNRQYLTGLRMGGQRVVILVDVSTSMLDRTLVNVLRRRNMSVEDQRRAPKWRQAVDTVDWLTAQIQPGTQVQVIAFNGEARSLIEGSEGGWVEVTDGANLEQAVNTLRNEIVPGGPTSMHAAFGALRALEPKPDNVYLIVDGLPTMGAVTPSRAGVTGRERVDHFQRAIRDLPYNVPINVILLAMEGDPESAPEYWKLALRTGGSMLAPAEDWP